MADEIDLNIGSFDLDQTNNIAVSDIDFTIAKSIQEFDLPKFHGAVVPIGKRKALIVRLRGTMISTGYDALRTALDSLKAAFEGTAEKNLTLDDDRIMKVQYRNFSYSYKTLRTFIDFSVELIASDPFWYAASVTTEDQNPATSGAGFTVNNAGNARTRAKLTISNSGSTIGACKIQNTTIGQTFEYRGSVSAGQNLVVNNRVDSVDVEVTNNGTDDIKNFEGDLIELDPGDNTIVFTGTAGTRVQVARRAAYY